MEADDTSANVAETKLLTFQTWVTDARWYDYAVKHPELVPFLLIDRSPCQDPFFDPLAAPQQRRPVISGLCRGRAMRNLHVGDRFMYITRIAPAVAGQLGLATNQGSLYFAVALPHNGACEVADWLFPVCPRWSAIRFGEAWRVLPPDPGLALAVADRVSVS